MSDKPLTVRSTVRQRTLATQVKDVTMTTIDRDIKAAVDYILPQFANGDIPKDALRLIVEDRVRMVCADALRWQAGALHGAANQLTVRLDPKLS